MAQAGVGFWLRDPAAVKQQAEALAKTRFAATRDPSSVAFLYAALGKVALLQVRSQITSDDVNTFSQSRWSTFLPLAEAQCHRNRALGFSRRSFMHLQLHTLENVSVWRSCGVWDVRLIACSPGVGTAGNVWGC